MYMATYTNIQSAYRMVFSSNQEEAGGYVYRVYCHEDFPDILMLMSYGRHMKYESSNFLSKLL